MLITLHMFSLSVMCTVNTQLKLLPLNKLVCRVSFRGGGGGGGGVRGWLPPWIFCAPLEVIGVKMLC